VNATDAVFVTGGSGFIGGRLIRRLVADGRRVRGLARSDDAAEKVAGAGAEPVRGDLSDPAALRAGAEGCELAFHAAASVLEWGPREEFVRANVDGTERVLDACREAGVRRLVHVGTEAATMAGQPLVKIDETAPLRPDSKADYCATKALAEQAVRAANGDRLQTVVVRPRLVWGEGDTTILPGVVEAVRAGRFRWIAGGRHETSTTHVDNVVQGLVLGAEQGRPGEAYFVTDGDPVVFRDFITELVGTQGVEIPDKGLPKGVAGAVAAGSEAVFRTLRLKGAPPLTRMAYWLSALECTIDISKAREELGYAPVRTIEDGMAELRSDGLG
jgi:nucleoside-diphosphate-sugar epimerase